MKLIENWKVAYKFWSVKLGVIGTIITTIFVGWPDSALSFWGLLPDEIRYMLPPRLVPLIGVFLFVMSIAARVIKQRKLRRPDDEQHKEE